MIRKLLSTVMIATLIAMSVSTVLAQEEKTESSGSSVIKGIMLDLGYGGSGLSAGVGFRYWNVSAAIGIAGFANDIPNYARSSPTGVTISPSQPLPSGYSEDHYTSIDVYFDAGYHYDFYPYSVFAQVGFYSAQDSILAKNMETGSKYFYATESTSGFCFGLGGEYIVNDQVTLGVGYHTRRGGFARFTYTWW